jgi:hypothetical protein
VDKAARVPSKRDRRAGRAGPRRFDPQITVVQLELRAHGAMARTVPLRPGPKPGAASVHARGSLCFDRGGSSEHRPESIGPLEPCFDAQGNGPSRRPQAQEAP